MANEQNLTPEVYSFSNKTPEERQMLASKAGKASGESKRQAKTMKELAMLMLSMQEKKENIKDKVKDYFPDLVDSDITKQAVLLAKQFDKALKGDSKAFELLRDTSGQKPIEKQEIENNINLENIKLPQLDLEAYKEALYKKVETTDDVKGDVLDENEF